MALSRVIGDIFGVSEVLTPFFELFPIVVSGSAPTANFSGGILRVIGSDLSTAYDLLGSFQVGGSLETLSIDNGANALIISADTQATGEDQSLFFVESSVGEISITQLALLNGNSLDIDEWHVDNFSYIV